METRTLQVTLEKAKEWYNSDDESLRKIALEVYTEEELNPILKASDYKGEAYIVSDYGNICTSVFPGAAMRFPTENLAKRVIAYSELTRLCAMTKGWIEDVKNYKDYKFVIYCTFSDNLNISSPTHHPVKGAFMQFETKEIAEKFFQDHRALIETYYGMNENV